MFTTSTALTLTLLALNSVLGQQLSLSETPVSFNEAEAACIAQGQKLASFNSEDLESAAGLLDKVNFAWFKSYNNDIQPGLILSQTSVLVGEDLEIKHHALCAGGENKATDHRRRDSFPGDYLDRNWYSSSSDEGRRHHNRPRCRTVTRFITRTVTSSTTASTTTTTTAILVSVSTTTTTATSTITSAPWICGSSFPGNYQVLFVPVISATQANNVCLKYNLELAQNVDLSVVSDFLTGCIGITYGVIQFSTASPALAYITFNSNPNVSTWQEGTSPIANTYFPICFVPNPQK